MHPVGITEIIIFSSVYFGILKFKFGRTIIKLSSKYKKFAKSVAKPTPINPILGINMMFRITPIIPEISFIVNSICVLFAKWYCNVV